MRFPLSHERPRPAGRTCGSGYRPFAGALDFANRVGAIAEAEGHHPDLLVAWGRVEVTIWTHKINGLTESDFILAAKIDQLV